MKTMVSLTADNHEKVVKCDNDNGKAVNVRTFFHKWQLEPKVKIADHLDPDLGDWLAYWTCYLMSQYMHKQWIPYKHL